MKMLSTLFTSLALTSAILIANPAEANKAKFLPQGDAPIYTDATAELFDNGFPHLDITQMNVTNTATNLIFTLTVNANINTTNWGKYMIGISTGKNAGTTTGNGWGRPINMTSPVGGMDFWVGSWVDAPGGGAQLWKHTGAWSEQTGSVPGIALAPGATSTITFTVSLASLGLVAGDAIYFDTYSSGGGGADGAVDALANPAQSIAGWGNTYTSSRTQSMGTGLNKYTVSAPLPVVFGDVKAFKNRTGIEVNWAVATEINIDEYQVQRSANGTSFSTIKTVTARNVGNLGTTYAITDATALKGKNYYRVVAVENGDLTYSRTAFLNNLDGKAAFTVALQPAGNILVVKVNGLTAGNYNINLVNNNGQLLQSNTLVHDGADVVKNISLKAGLAAGIYRVVLTGEGQNLTQAIMVR
jgi:hypothetical protein